MLFGTPEYVIDKIKELKSELNLQNLQVWSNFPGVKHEDCMKSIKMFKEKVMPNFKDEKADNNAKNIIQANRVFTSFKEWKTELAKGPYGYHNLLQPKKGLEVLESIKNWLKHVAEKEKIDSMVINTSYKVHVLLEQLDRTIKGAEIDTLTVLKLIKQQLNPL